MFSLDVSPNITLFLKISQGLSPVAKDWGDAALGLADLFEQPDSGLRQTAWGSGSLSCNEISQQADETVMAVKKVQVY